MSLQGFVVYAKHKERVSAFCQLALGLDVVASEASHDVLRGRGYEIVIHAIPEPYAVGITISTPPVAREDCPFKPVFIVASLEQVRRAAESTGGLLKADTAAWQWHGRKVLDGWDPEGNIMQFQQPS